MAEVKMLGRRVVVVVILDLDLLVVPRNGLVEGTILRERNIFMVKT
jgi:hypothetical protein